MASPAALEPGPLVTLVRRRTVAKVDSMGSSHNAAAATIKAVNNQRRNQAGPGTARVVFHTSSRVSTIIVETSSSASVISVIVTLAAGIPNQAKGQKMTAASGG